MCNDGVAARRRPVGVRAPFTGFATPSITGALSFPAAGAAASDDRQDPNLSGSPAAAHPVPGGRSRHRGGELPQAGGGAARGRDLLRGEGQPGAPGHRAARSSGFRLRYRQHLRDRALPRARDRPGAHGLWKHGQEGTRYRGGARIRREPVRVRQRGRTGQARARRPRGASAVPSRHGGRRRGLAVIGKVRLSSRHGGRSARTRACCRARPLRAFLPCRVAAARHGPVGYRHRALGGGFQRAQPARYRAQDDQSRRRVSRAIPARRTACRTVRRGDFRGADPSLRRQPAADDDRARSLHTGGRRHHPDGGRADLAQVLRRRKALDLSRHRTFRRICPRSSTRRSSTGCGPAATADRPGRW